MKPFDDLTDAEILALTDEQIDYYIDRTCAEQGVALVPPTPPDAPTLQPIEDDVTVYDVAGSLFTDMGEAERVRAMLVTISSRVETSYTYPGYRNYVKPVTEPVSITPKHLLSEQRALAKKDALAAFEEQKRTYEKNRAEYDTAVRGHEAVATSIRAEVRRVHDEDDDRREHQREFERYVTLADGDRRIAWRFLCRVRSRAERLLPELSKELGGPDVVCAPAEPVAVGDDIAF